MAKGVNPFRLKKACGNCPFRSDVSFPLHPARTLEIANSILSGQAFMCHQTLDYGNIGDGFADPYRTQACYGALLVSERSDIALTLRQVWERLYKMVPDLTDRSTPVYETIDDWVTAMLAEGEKR